jgi:16S rRNA (guanine966-N2)-methyltransferase
MRIIAGEFRGRKLLPPEGDVTRPITDRVKQSLFDILTPLLPDARVYDVFAGTGSMGLECLSRGAAHATFFEADRSALARLRTNLQSLAVEGRARVIGGDLFRWIDDARHVPPGDGRRIDVAFLDPPYRFLRERPDALRRLAETLVLRHLRPDSAVVFRHDADDRLDLPGLRRYDERRYSGMALEFFTPQTPAAPTGDGR